MIQSKFGLREDGTRSSETHFGSCSFHIIAHIETFIADVDIVDIEEDVAWSSHDAAAAPENHGDAGIISIVNDDTTEHVDTHAEEVWYLLKLRTKCTKRHNNKSAEKNTSDSKKVVLFVRKSIASSVDRQKSKADNNESTDGFFS